MSVCVRARAFIRSGEEVIDFLKIRKNRTDEGEWPCLCSLIVFVEFAVSVRPCSGVHRA